MGCNNSCGGMMGAGAAMYADQGGALGALDPQQFAAAWGGPGAIGKRWCGPYLRMTAFVPVSVDAGGVVAYGSLNRVLFNALGWNDQGGDVIPTTQTQVGRIDTDLYPGGRILPLGWTYTVHAVRLSAAYSLRRIDAGPPVLVKEYAALTWDDTAALLRTIQDTGIVGYQAGEMDSCRDYVLARASDAWSREVAVAGRCNATLSGSDKDVQSEESIYFVSPDQVELLQLNSAPAAGNYVLPVRLDLRGIVSRMAQLSG